MITKTTEKLIAFLKKGMPENLYVGEGVTRVQVDIFVSRIAKIYEKIRNAIDYKEDHLLRKNAIYRILQRRLMIKLSTDGLAEGLIKELIRGGYLDNDYIPLKKIDEVQRVIEKYLSLYNLSGIKRYNGQGQKVFRWLIEICSCEIEESIMPPIQQRALVEFMFQLMQPEVKIADKELSEKERALHVYLAIYRALVKSDISMVNYLLFKYYNPNWSLAGNSEIMAAAKKIRNLKKKIEEQQNYYLAEKLFRLFKKYTFVFLVLRDVILENPKRAQEIFNNPKELEFQIVKVCNELYHKAKTKLRRSIVRVTIYIFVSKMLLALLLELPYDIYIAREVVYMPLVINAIFPALLMVLIGTFIRVPSKKNTNKVVSISQQVVYQNKVADLKGIDKAIKENYFWKTVFNCLYFILFSVSFGVLIYVLWKLNFTTFSIFIFLLFLSIVSFFGIKLRYNIRELTVFDKKENPLIFLVNIFSLPFLNVGHWIAIRFVKINIFVFILDFIIEAPFKVFLEVIEDWINFLKEKKEEIYNQQ